MKFVICLFIFVFMLNISYSQNFILNSLEESVAISEQIDKPVLLILGNESCSFCKKIQKDIFEDKELIQSIDKFIICYIDIDKNPKYKTEYNITIIPHSIILHNNKIISQLKGYEKQKYLRWLQSAN
jgi:thioredoxin-related protein